MVSTYSHRAVHSHKIQDVAEITYRVLAATTATTPEASEMEEAVLIKTIPSQAYSKYV